MPDQIPFGAWVKRQRRALGLTQDLSARGLGRRSQRYAMLVDDQIVKYIAVESPGKFEVSDAASMLAVLR